MVVTNYYVLGEARRLVSGTKEPATTQGHRGSNPDLEDCFLDGLPGCFDHIIHRGGHGVHEIGVGVRRRSRRRRDGLGGRGGTAFSRFAFGYVTTVYSGPLGPVLGLTREQTTGSIREGLEVDPGHEVL